MLCSLTTGYRISPQALNAVIKRYSKAGRIYFDDYVACAVKLRALTGKMLTWRLHVTMFNFSFFYFLFNSISHFLTIQSYGFRYYKIT